ncbi:MAG: 1-phosphofructokinase family hexose kinase [Acidobacteriota bacterium]
MRLSICCGIVVVIICISLNPAIDRRLHVAELLVGRVNRAASARSTLGGKAAHVATASRALGAEVLWIGFLGMATGEECERELNALTIPSEIVRTKSATRVNLEIIGADGTITEILEPGGPIDKDESDEMLAVCSRLFEHYKKEAQVILTGSLPRGLPTTYYATLIHAAHQWGCFVMLDTSGEALLTALSALPDLIKPNREEAALVLGMPITNDETAITAARRFLELGAQSVALSLGSQGLVWLSASEMQAVIVRPPVVSVTSTVGCGDATLAGLAVARSRKDSSRDGLVLAVSCGAANCLATSPGRIDPLQVSHLAPLIEVCEL